MASKTSNQNAARDKALQALSDALAQLDEVRNLSPQDYGVAFKGIIDAAAIIRKAA